MTAPAARRRAVALLLFDDVEVLDFAGPFEFFAVTDELSGGTTFNVFTVGVTPGSIRARNGLKVVPDFTPETAPAADILIVPGGAGTRPLLRQPSLLEWVAHRARQAEVVLSVCTGSLVLARIGLLDGLTATTHHENLSDLASLAPTAIVDGSKRFHDHGHIVTAAGISAGIDASLHLVGRLLGVDAATRTAVYMEYGDHAFGDL